MVVRTSRIPAWFGAQALTVSPSLVLVLPERINDRALIAHEETHADQMADVGWLTFWWQYLTSRRFRQMAEVEAYQVQMLHGASPHACARNLATMYRLGISEERALQLLLT